MKKVLAVLFTIVGTSAFSQLSLIETHQSPSCFGGCNGIIAVTPNNAVGAVTYTWLPTGTINYSLCAGQYTVLAEDAGANTASLSVTISNPTQMTATIVAQNTINCTCTGSATVTVTGGSAPYNYAWNTPFGNNMPQVFNLCPGITQVNITDINGCVVSQTVAIMPAPMPTVAVSATNAACQGYCNGTASATVTGGTPGYSFQWNGPSIAAGQNTHQPMGMCPGTYTVLVTDAFGCQANNLVNITSVNSIPNASVTSTIYNETCLYTGDGAIDVSITGSNPGPFTYQWNNGATTQDLNNIVSSSYIITVFDSNFNCVSLNNTVVSIGTNCGTISGNVFADNNSDCINNSGDNDLSNLQVVINPGNRLGYTNPNGDYSVNNLPYGTYTVSANTNTVYFAATCTTSYTATVNGSTPNAINKNFAREYIPVTQPDLYVSAYSNGIVPGFVCYVRYILGNSNSIPGTGLYKAILPSAFISNITTGTPAGYAISGDTVIWNFSNITNASGAQFLYINFTVPLSTPLGSTFSTCIDAQSNIGDSNPANNTFCYQRLVTGSFDPNDKTVSPVGLGAGGDIPFITTDLTYLIRFQNTGNGPAVNIVVKDTISPNVDINTFEMLSASHNYNVDILPGNIVRWKFNNIMLVDSGTNEPASHGYIQYRIKRTPVYQPGTQIKNTAYIYFDFNEPVVTNTAINTIEYITDVKSSVNSNNEWSVYPNPSTGVLYIVNSSSIKEESQIQVINSIGQTVLEETITSNYKNIDLSKLNNGIYFVKIVSDKQSVIKRVVLSR